MTLVSGPEQWYLLQLRVLGAWWSLGSSAPVARELFKPNAWIEIRPAGAVPISTSRSEMGQGVRTAMQMIVAEELEADWTRVRVAHADADPAYGDQFTVGSRSVRSG